MTVYELADCPLCGTRDFRTIADADAIKREVEALWQFHARRMFAGAPVQQFFDRAIYSQEPPWQVVRCATCGMLLRNPRESIRSLLDVYANEQLPERALQALFEQQQVFYRKRVHSLRRMVGRSGAVLEVGSYLGAFLTAAQADGWRAQGIDVNASAARFAAARGGKVARSELQDYQAGRALDVVAFWNCFEQLPEPRAALLRAQELLGSDGWLVLRVPNGEAYRVFRTRPGGAAILAQNNLLGFPYRHGFTSASLRGLVSDIGFRDIRVRGDTLVATAGTWTRPWAAREERALKLLLRTLLPARIAPWLELYARV